MVGEQPVGEITEGKTAEGHTNGGKEQGEEGSTSGRDMVFICVKVWENTTQDCTI